MSNMNSEINHINLAHLKDVDSNDIFILPTIGLCNIIYIIISKILVQRLRSISARIFLKSQAASIPAGQKDH